MRCMLFCYILTLCTVPLLVKGQLFIKPLYWSRENIKDSASVTKDWQRLENALQKLVNGATELILPGLEDTMRRENTSSTCIREIMQVLEGIRRLETWAMRFPDSSAMIPSGGITGTSFNYGSYGECIDTVATVNSSGKHKGEEATFAGKYCLLKIKPSLPPKKLFYKTDDVIDEMKRFKNGTILRVLAKYIPRLDTVPIRLGLCVPSGCSLHDINQLFANVADQMGVYMKVNRCEVKEDPKFTPVMIIVMSVYSLAGYMVLLGTITDIYSSYSSMKEHSMATRILLSFSFISNFRKFVVTSTFSKSLSCFNGISFISMSWIILGHTYMFNSAYLAGNVDYVMSQAKEVAEQVIMNSYLAVDTLFFLGGFLVCYLAAKLVLIENKSFRIPFYIIRKIWRILPVYIMIILYAFIMELTCSGPAAHDIIEYNAGGCKHNWWTNFLFINNFYHESDMCWKHTWYIAVDFQLYVASLIILLPLLRWPKAGISIAVAATVGSIIACAAVTYVNNFPPTLQSTIRNLELMEIYGTEFYIKPYPHAGPYIIGIIAGYLLALNPSLKIPKVVQLMGWSSSVILSLSALYGIYEWNQGTEQELWKTTFYASCHRIAWILSIAWIVICCATSNGGIVNYILSWKAWIPLGRLTFNAYLIHPLVQLSLLTMLRGPLQPVHSNIVWIFFGDLLVTYGAAFAVSMIVESPFLALEKLILSQCDDETTKETGKAPGQDLDNVKVSKDEDIARIRTTCSLVPESQLQYSGTENSGFVHTSKF